MHDPARTAILPAMQGPSPVRRAIPGLLLAGLLLGVAGIATAATAPESEAPAAAAEESSPGWGPIAGACLGVLFGGALAVWQIRGMKARG